MLPSSCTTNPTTAELFALSRIKWSGKFGTNIKYWPMEKTLKLSLLFSSQMPGRWSLHYYRYFLIYCLLLIQLYENVKYQPIENTHCLLVDHATINWIEQWVRQEVWWGGGGVEWWRGYMKSRKKRFSPPTHFITL